MTFLNADPAAVARGQVSANIPMFLFTLLAAALIGMLDLRRFLPVLEGVLLAVTVSYAAMASLGVVTQGSLLVLTFVLSAVWALAAPPWLAATPLLVPWQDLDALTAINSASYNVGRAAGPVLGRLAVAAFGIAASHWISGVFILACISVLLRWRSSHRSAAGLPVGG